MTKLHGVSATKGHLADNGGLRAHSVDDVFPWVVFQKGERKAILTPSGDIFFPILTDCWKYAHSIAACLKAGDVRGYDPVLCAAYSNPANWELRNEG